jgi:AraC-like DNA-binding protein
LARKTNDQFIFQYTYAGLGKFRSFDTEHRIEQGCAFLAKTGTNHRYYLPEDSKLWEFAFITLSGQEALACWAYAHEKVGDVIRFAPDSPVIRSLESILGLAAAKEVLNGYAAAGLATQFLMELYQALKYRSVPSEDEPEVIEQARIILSEHYRYIGSMREVAATLGMEPYQFSRLFHRSTGLTAVQFLTKVRLEKAMELLRNTDMTLQEISLAIGYSCDNYFNKVFRKSTGLSPGQFRRGEATIPKMDHIAFDFS